MGGAGEEERFQSQENEADSDKRGEEDKRNPGIVLRIYHFLALGNICAMILLVIFTIYVPASFNTRGLVCIQTNTFGEHWIEFIILVISFMLFIHYVWVSEKKVIH